MDSRIYPGAYRRQWRHLRNSTYSKLLLDQIRTVNQPEKLLWIHSARLFKAPADVKSLFEGCKSCLISTYIIRSIRRRRFSLHANQSTVDTPRLHDISLLCLMHCLSLACVVSLQFHTAFCHVLLQLSLDPSNHIFSAVIRLQLRHI